MPQANPLSHAAMVSVHDCITAIHFNDSGVYPASQWDALERLDPQLAAIAKENTERAFLISKTRTESGESTEVAHAQAMPPLTDAMRAVLRNEKDLYGSEDELYAALCAAAGLPAPVETIKASKASPSPVGEAGSMPGTTGFTMAVFKASDVPVGSKLYTSPFDTKDGEAR